MKKGVHTYCHPIPSITQRCSVSDIGDLLKIGQVIKYDSQVGI